MASPSFMMRVMMTAKNAVTIAVMRPIICMADQSVVPPSAKGLDVAVSQPIVSNRM